MSPVGTVREGEVLGLAEASEQGHSDGHRQLLRLVDHVDGVS